MSSAPQNLPTIEPLYAAVVDIGPRRSLGKSPLGERFIIDSLGGTFEGPRLRGRVLAGGADRQLVRLTAPDGPHAWLNRRIFVGTLTPLPAERRAVRIGVYLLR